MPFDGRQLNETTRHLLRAKEYLENNGWCSTGPRGEAGEVCISSAIALAAPGWNHRAGYIMGVALGVEPSYIDGHTIGQWNDAPGRLLNEVLAAFDKAIALAMEEDHAVCG